jgi:hypothetical protein
MTTTEYMKQLWNLANNPSDLRLQESLFIVHVCRVHAHRFLKMKISESYRTSSQTQEITGVWKSLRFAFINSHSLPSFFRRVWDIFVLTRSKFYTDEVRRVVKRIDNPTVQGYSFNEFLKGLVEHTFMLTRQNVLIKLLDAWDQGQFEFRQPPQGTPFWRRNPWGQYGGFVDDMIQSRDELPNRLDKLQAHERRENPFYSEDLANYFKVSV